MSDTGAAKLPAIPRVSVPDPALGRWVQAVTEWVEVRTGARGNAAERAVTQRELSSLAGGLQTLAAPKTVQPGDVLLKLGGGMSASVQVEALSSAIKDTALYKDLVRRMDDPRRFDELQSELRSVLLQSIAAEASKRGADISRVDTKIQDANRSIAMQVQELTAATDRTASGLREMQAVAANTTSATATKVSQLEVSLGNFYQDGQPGRASLETQMLAQADYTTGLRAQYTMKVSAGGALAGYGIAATEVNGVPSSAFIIQADKFAIVSPDYSGGLTSSPDNRHIPFGVDANGIYLNSTVYINGKLIVDGSIKASKIDTRGLSIRDEAGNIILSAGSSVSTSSFGGNLTGYVAGTNAVTLVNTANAASNNANAALYAANTANNNAANAMSAAASRLAKSGADILTGPITMNAASAILVGNLSNGLYLGNTGLVGIKSGAVTFAVDQYGNAQFAGNLQAATGTFSGKLTAQAIDAVGTVNIAGNAATACLSASTMGSQAIVTVNLQFPGTVQVIGTCALPLTSNVYLAYRYSGGDWMPLRGELLAGGATGILAASVNVAAGGWEFRFSSDSGERASVIIFVSIR